MKLFLILAAVLGVSMISMNVEAEAKDKDKGKERKLYFYNWSEYLPEGLIKQFEKETGIKVIYSTYDSNEAMYAKVKLLKDNVYDLIVPSSYYVGKLIKEDLLAKIDKTKIPLLKNLDGNLMGKPFDPKNDYSLPYLWGATILTVNSKKIDPKNVTSWDDLWKPEFKKQILLLNDYREVFFIALKTLGFSGNTRDPKQIEKAYEKLKGLMPNIRIFESQSPKTSFLAGEVNLGAIWNGELFMAQNENPAIKGVLPKEGLIFFMDNLTIPKNAKNKEEAYQFINFLMRPEIAKAISEEIGYATPNKEALKLLDAKIKSNKFLYPPEEYIKNGEFQEDIGDAVVIYEKYWEKLKGL